MKNAVNSHIKVSENKYCQVPIVYDSIAKQPIWKEQDKECYNIWSYAQLPSAEAIVKNPTAYAETILLPYKNGMAGFVASKIGTGVSVVDKASLHRSVFTLLGNMICEQPEAERVMPRGHKLKKYSSPQEYADSEDFRNWVRQCAATDQIIFELYGLWKSVLSDSGKCRDAAKSVLTLLGEFRRANHPDQEQSRSSRLFHGVACKSF